MHTDRVVMMVYIFESRDSCILSYVYYRNQYCGVATVDATVLGDV